MYYFINTLSPYAGQILKTASGGTVHSVYRKTINLLIGGKLTALQAADSPLSPISLICSLSADAMKDLPVCQGDPVSLRDGYIEIHTATSPLRFSYADAVYKDLCLSHSPAPDSCEILAAHIRKALKDTKTGGFEIIFNKRINNDSSLIFQVAKKHIQEASALYREGKPSESARELSRLLGLGIGLTPSGDDFLCGVLAGLFLSGQNGTTFAQALRAEIRAHLADTLDVSAAFLSCALDNQFSLAVNSLYTIPSSEELLTVFSEIGHSSGMDTLCGVLFALEL